MQIAYSLNQIRNDLLIIAVDFDEDGVADNINFIIKRIKVWTSASAPGYRYDRQ